MSMIELNDTIVDVVSKMSEGNPGAITAMMVMVSKTEAIDPQDAMGNFGPLAMLDSWEIYGSDIYVLYNDKCDRDVRKMLMLMRATQLGYFSHFKLKEMASDQMRQINLTEEEFDKLDDKVCEQLTEFKKKTQ